MTLAQSNQARWDACQINLNKLSVFKAVAARLSAPEAKSRYQTVSKITGVPWWFIAVVHEREASQSWLANIAQGDSWSRKSTHVPRGRGPFKSWEDAAVDALTNCAPYAARNTDWSIGSALAMLEKYNGLGYYNKGIPSPYIWAGTNQYKKGKYVADGVFKPNAVDQQLGCAGILKQMNISTSSGPAIATGSGIAVAGGSLATYFQNHWLLIIGASIAAAILIGTAVHFYRRKNA